MAKRLIFCLLLINALWAEADQSVIVGQLTGDADEVYAHVRCNAKHFSLCINGADTTRIEVDRIEPTDNLYGLWSKVQLKKGGVVIASQEVAHADNAFSLCLTADEGGTLLAAGDGSRIFDGKVDFRPVAATSLTMHADPRQVVCNDFRVSYRPLRRKCSVDICDYLATSADTLEGVWQWLDCRTDAPAVTAGGRYTLATLSAGEGYDIVYIDGAGIGSWQPLDIKGHMTATDFVNHFDATWLDSDGRDVGEGVYISLDNNDILTVTFTPLRSELRFTRRSTP